MSELTCSHPDHEAQDEKRAYAPGWEAAHHHKIIHGHSPVPAPPPVEYAAPKPTSLKRGPDGLTDQQRDVRRLHNAGMPHRDIARELGITTNAVTTSVYRLRATGRLDPRPAQEVTP